MTMNTAFRIPEKVYIKFQRRTRASEEEGGEAYLLGFMVPYDEKDPQLNERKLTVSRWSQGRGGGKRSVLDNQARLYYNEPLQGIKLLHTVSRYRTSNKVWRVSDPRGFELEISSWNLSALLHHVTIAKGVIQDECVWARDSQGENWLLPVSSTEYKEAQEYTELRNTRISLRDVNLGDIITLHDGRTVKYLGGMYYPVWSREFTTEKVSTHIKRHYVFLEKKKDVESWEDATLGAKSSLKVGELVEAASEPLTPEQAEGIANDKLHPRDRVLFYSASKFQNKDLEVFTKDFEFDKVEDFGPSRVFLIALFPGTGLSYIYTGYGEGYGVTGVPDSFDIEQVNPAPLFSDFNLEYVTRQVRAKRSYFNSTYTRIVSQKVTEEALLGYDWKEVWVRVKGNAEFKVSAVHL